MAVKIECDRCGLTERVIDNRDIHDVCLNKLNNKTQWKGHLCEKCIEDIINFIKTPRDTNE